MWPFKKKVVPKKLAEEKPIVTEKKLVKKVRYKTESKELGKTTIKYTLKDGREFYSVCYGHFQQSVSGLMVCEPYIYSSLVQAIQFISDNYFVGVVILKDDLKNLKEMVIGEVISAKIGETVPYSEDCQVAYIVEELE